ncbi:MAG: hypothetical protein VX122_00310, partial [Pseudomonadota bacterium]|nr:hypothetical protein [Pseudomonadota bacterium]
MTLAALRLAVAEELRIQNGEAAATDASVQLYVFNCGDFRFPSVANFSIGDDETTVRELVVPCYIINHPRGTLLWDGGLPSAIAKFLAGSETRRPVFRCACSKRCNRSCSKWIWALT